MVRYVPSTNAVTVYPDAFPTGLEGMSAISTPNGRSYTFGGETSSGPTKAVYRIGSGGTVVPQGSLPTAREHTSAVYDGEYAYIYGGWPPASTQGIVSHFPGLFTSTVIEPLPTPLHDSSAVWNGSVGYVFGGHTDINESNKTAAIVEHNPKAAIARTSVASLPSPRAYTSAASDDGRNAYIFGGVIRDQYGGQIPTNEIVGFEPPIRYVALGDSYSSGEGNDPYEEGTDTEQNNCHRSPDAYSRSFLFPVSRQPQLDFFACSGALTTDLWRDSKSGEPPQLTRSEVNAETELVTITIGGNDANFFAAITECAASPDCTALPGTQDPTKTTREYTLDTIDELPNKLAKAYAELKARVGANDAIGTDTVVVVLGYPHIFDDPDSISEQLDCIRTDGALYGKPERDFFAEAVDKVRDLTAQEAAAAGFHFKDVIGDFNGHGKCGVLEDWLYGVELTEIEGSFHPNQAGQQGYESALQDYIGAKLAAGPAEASGLPPNPQ